MIVFTYFTHSNVMFFRRLTTIKAILSLVLTSTALLTESRNMRKGCVISGVLKERRWTWPSLGVILIRGDTRIVKIGKFVSIINH